MAQVGGMPQQGLSPPTSICYSHGLASSLSALYIGIDQVPARQLKQPSCTENAGGSMVWAVTERCTRKKGH